MNIIIFDVAAESGGALSILNDFYNEFKSDTLNNYFIIVSTPKLESTLNVNVKSYSWIKKSWLHRLFFDYCIAPKLIKKNKIDKVISLQNIIIPRVTVEQTVYIHNSLPFVEYKYSFFENRLLWVYQNIIGKLIFNSAKNASKVIVQTEWMKKKCIDLLKISADNISVLPPKIDIKVDEYFNKDVNSYKTFFYPASAMDFKNHKVIIEASLSLKENGIQNYRIIFTISGNENKNIEKLHDLVIKNNLPIEFLGAISRKSVYDYYKNTTLLFPSYIESSPLPLTEAKMHNTPIIASDCNFSHEILEGYQYATFFDPFDSEELKQRLLTVLSKYN